ncbi:MAG: hypothetical protein HC915_06545, partial [Anaerolineae bacterium]|nr:hypothetical protein [Anaerolineae bacterium]
MFGLVVVAVRMTNLWVRQPHPWDALQDGLKGVSGDLVLYNFLLPAPHVLVAPSGIYAIETRFQDRPQQVSGDRWRPNRGLFTFMRQEQIGNPSNDAQQAAA